jgi:hypothetical protein
MRFRLPTLARNMIADTSAVTEPSPEACCRCAIKDQNTNAKPPDTTAENIKAAAPRRAGSLRSLRWRGSLTGGREITGIGRVTAAAAAGEKITGIGWVTAAAAAGEKITGIGWVTAAAAAGESSA